LQAQRRADGFASVDWVRVLGRYARQINPLLGGLLSPMRYYWVTSQSEYSTDVLFRSRTDLEELFPRLLQYYFEARDVMSFLGRKLNGNFQGDLVTDQLDFSQLPRRLPARRVKHRMKRNWIKMYNKEGSVLRVETVINQPDEFRIRRRVRRQGRHVTAWVPVRKGVAFLPRYRQICAQTNGALPRLWLTSMTQRPRSALSTPRSAAGSAIAALRQLGRLSWLSSLAILNPDSTSREAESMVQVQNILWLTDFSKDSAHALAYARTLAELCNTKLYLMHVIENPTSSIYGAVEGDYLAMEANAREKAGAWLDDAARGLGDFPDKEVVLREGEVLREVLNIETEKDIGTIVLGTHGRTGLAHLLLGSVAEKVIRSVHCPV
jgi:nucleotide-binding universal stress UspA family protein